MKKKLALSIAAAAMIGTLAVGGTLAWFTDVETATNVVTTGNVDIAIYEKGEGDEEPYMITEENKDKALLIGTAENPVTPGKDYVKEVDIRNTGKNNALIRVKVEIKDKAGKATTNLVCDGKSEKWSLDENDKYFYYTEIVEVDGITEKLMTEVVANGDTLTNDNFADQTYTIEISAEAIQADNLVGENVNLTAIKAAFAGKDIVNYTEGEGNNGQ